MKRYCFLFPVAIGMFLLFLAASCKNSDKKSPGQSENNLDAARNFIRAALDGKFNRARLFLFPDSVNINYMDVAERSYQRADQDVKDGYRSASINIIEVKNPVKDSITVVIFSNSFKNDPDTLKLINSNGKWLVDLKYLYLHQEESVQSVNSNDAPK